MGDQEYPDPKVRVVLRVIVATKAWVMWASLVYLGHRVHLDSQVMVNWAHQGQLANRVSRAFQDNQATRDQPGRMDAACHLNVPCKCQSLTMPRIPKDHLPG